MKTKLLLFFIFCGFLSFGQIVYQHDFGTTAITATNYTVAPNVFDANLNSSNWTNSNGAFTSFAGSSGQALSLNNSAGTPTITLNFNVATGFQLSVNSYDFWRTRSGTGAQNYSMAINGITVGSGTIPTTSATIGVTTVTNPVNNLTGTISVVITLSGASGTGTFRLDDFILNGTVYPTCTPPTNPTGTITGTTPACTSTSLNFSGTATAPIVNYWQTTPTGTSTSNDAASVLNVTSSGNYYVRAYNSTTMCWSAGTIGPYAVTVNPVQNITTQPTNSSIVAGANSSFSVVASNATSYQWQVDMGLGFNNITNVAPYSNATTATLNITNTPLTFNGYIYRCIVNGTSPCVAINSVSATLSVTALAPFFRSNVANGNWNTASSWQSSTDNVTWITSASVPDNNAVAITIRNGFNINSNGNITADDITIETGAILTISLGTFTLNDGLASIDLQVNGTLTYSGGTFTQNINSGIAFGAASNYNHTILTSILKLPIANWNATSNCTVSGMNNSGPIVGTNMGQSFGNFIWNNNNQTNPSSYVNIENNAFIVVGTMTVGPSINNYLSFGNSGTYSNTINKLVVSGGLLNVAGSANVTLNVTNDVNVTGTTPANYGTLAVSGGSGNAILNVGTDVLINQSGSLAVINNSSSPNATLNITGDLIISDAIGAQLNLENVSSTNGVAAVNVNRNFVCSTTGTTFASVDFGTGIVAGNAINIKRDFSKTGAGFFSTFSSNSATGFSFNGTAVQTLNYAGGNSNYTSYVIQNGSTLLLNSNLTLGTGTNPNSSFTVNGSLNFGTNSVIAGITTDPRFIANAGATLITANPNGFGGTTASGSLQNFGSMAITITNVGGRINLPNGVNFTFNGNTTTPFLVPTLNFGNPAIVNVNSIVVSNMTSNLTVSSAFNVNSGGSFALNSGNTNSLSINGASLNISSGGIFDNNGENQVTGGMGSSITINGKFITRDVQGFVGTNTAIPSITPVLNAGSSVEYALNGDQTVQGNAPTYANLILSNSGIKTLTSTNAVTESIIINNSAIFDAENKDVGGTGTNLIMTGTSEFRMAGTGVKPDAGGTYTLGNTTKLTFTNGSIALPIATLQSIRLNPTYANIDIVGNNVGTNTATGSIKFQPGATFRVLSNGIFKLSNTTGFSGIAQAAISNTTAPTIILQPDSTIEYAGDNQTITNFNSPFYTNLKINGTGIKTLANATQTFVNENLIVEKSKLLLSPNEVITVRNSVNITDATGEMELKNGAQLIQINETSANGGTNFKVARNASVVSLDYVYWSSPVENFSVTNIPDNNRYFWNPLFSNSNTSVGNWNSASSTMEKGRGYIVRSSTNGTLSANFLGKPNNGAFLKTIQRGNYSTAIPIPIGLGITVEDDNWNFLGNPYPSAISADKFLIKNANNDSKIDGSIWLWKHGIQPTSLVNPYYYNFAANYSSADYIKYNLMGATPPNLFDGFIASGQGFMVSMLDNAGTTSTPIPNTGDTTFVTQFYTDAVTFENNMRSINTTFTPYNNNQFFKTGSNKNANLDVDIQEKHRIWIDITNESVNQTETMLLGYAANATLNRDRLYDCFYTPKSEIAIYSLIENSGFIIQGRPLPFDFNDQIPLGINIASAGNHKIGVRQVDGLFTNNQTIYLQDLYLNTIHDLSANPYSFTTTTGKFNDRFVLRYTNGILGITSNVLEENIIVFAKNNSITVVSQSDTIESIEVFNILGKQIAKQINVNSMQFVLDNILATKQTLLVKIKLVNGVEKIQKVIL
jgi:hypothetical protein